MTIPHPWWADMLPTVTVPEGRSGPLEIVRFDVDEAGAFRSLLSYGPNREVPPGSYTKLVEHTDNSTKEHPDYFVWMSDTPAERRDHIIPVMSMFEGARVLIHGLGIGVVVQAAIRKKVSHIDVVEYSGDVIDLVGEHYEKMAAEAGVGLNIVMGDALKYKWPTGTKWDVVWHDIWPTIGEDNLPQMATLHRKFARRASWQGSWAHEQCRYARSHPFEDWTW